MHGPAQKLECVHHKALADTRLLSFTAAQPKAQSDSIANDDADDTGFTLHKLRFKCPSVFGVTDAESIYGRPSSNEGNYQMHMFNYSASSKQATNKQDGEQSTTLAHMCSTALSPSTDF